MSKPAQEDYKPQELTLEEFHTLTALASCLLPKRASGLAFWLSARFDSFLHQCRKEHWRLSELPPDIKAIRAGLQLLNFDALKLKGCPFPSLGISQREAILKAIRREGNAHWPQFPAGKWFEDVVSISAELIMSLPGRFIKAAYRVIPEKASQQSEAMG
jgi:hypothetical protein